MKILLLEDDVMLNSAIDKYLVSRGHIVETFRDGEQAYIKLQKINFDLLILDINVPNLNGLDLLQKIYKEKIMTPAIYISALIDIEEITKAYEVGCYDYLKKPFHLKELGLRIDKLLEVTKPPRQHVRLSKGYSFDISQSILLFYNNPQILPNRQLQIIHLLASNRGIVMSFDNFREYVWNNNDIDDATIRTEVNRVKKSLQEDVIQNIRSIGYVINKI